MARPLGATADACWRHHGGATVHARETSFVQNDFDDNNEEDDFDDHNEENEYDDNNNFDEFDDNNNFDEFDDNNDFDEFDDRNKEAGSFGFILRNTSEGIFQVYVFRWSLYFSNCCTFLNCEKLRDINKSTGEKAKSNLMCGN